MKKQLLKALAILAAGVAVYLAGIGIIDGYLDRKAWEAAAVVSYPMTNQHITWTGAGYNGIWEGGAGK